MISIKNLKHIYKDSQNQEVEALKDINLEIADGEFVAIIGANGCGKSTLAKHLNGLLLPTEGEVSVDGLNTADVDNLFQIRQKVGMVFQNPDNQIVAAVVEEDVAFGPENIGVPSEEILERVNNALTAVDMLPYAKHAPHRLSGGQKQRVAVAGILALEPKYIVWDEPTAMLDPSGRREVLNTALRLNKEKHITMIYITHYMTEALQADRVIVMNKGSVVMQGSPKEIFSQNKMLEKNSLEAPLAVRMSDKLRQRGAKLPEQIITNQELAEGLCPSN